MFFIKVLQGIYATEDHNEHPISHRTLFHFGRSSTFIQLKKKVTSIILFCNELSGEP